MSRINFERGSASRFPRQAQVSFEVSAELDKTINELVDLTNSSSKSELFRRAIALMKIAAEAQQKGEKIIIADQDRNPKVELQIY